MSRELFMRHGEKGVLLEEHALVAYGGKASCLVYDISEPTLFGVMYPGNDPQVQPRWWWPNAERKWKRLVASGELFQSAPKRIQLRGAAEPAPVRIPLRGLAVSCAPPARVRLVQPAEHGVDTPKVVGSNPAPHASPTPRVALRNSVGTKSHTPEQLQELAQHQKEQAEYWANHSPTGRIALRGPQIQNMAPKTPEGTAIRQAFQRVLLKDKP